MGVCNCSTFCCTLLYVHSSIAIILIGKREPAALLNLSSWCLVMVEWLFLAVLNKLKNKIKSARFKSLHNYILLHFAKEMRHLSHKTSITVNKQVSILMDSWLQND